MTFIYSTNFNFDGEKYSTSPNCCHLHRVLMIHSSIDCSVEMRVEMLTHLPFVSFLSDKSTEQVYIPNMLSIFAYEFESKLIFCDMYS